MKFNVSSLLLIACLFTITNAYSQKESFFEKANHFFHRHVEKNSVNYKEAKNDSSTIDFLLKQADSLYNGSVNNKQKALLINTYNLLVINTVIKNAPIASPMEVPGFFTNFKTNLGGKKYSLNDIENNLIRKKFNDARIHFALVCGAKSCPPIQPYAYLENQLDSTLNQVTRTSINDTNFIKIKTKDNETDLEISEIFKWYVADFNNSTKGIKSFITKYHESKLGDFKISYYTYDWSLNSISETNSINGNTPALLTTYTPSVLLRKGQIEVQAFNNLYTQTAWRDENGVKQNLGGRGSWNTLMLTFNYGISKSNRFNLGLDINLRSTSNGPEDSRAIDIFQFRNDDQNRTTISSIGPKVKLNLFKSIPKLSVQSALWIPVARDLEGTPWLDWQRYTWWTQFFYDKPIGTKFQLFTEIDALIRVRTDFDNANQDVFKLWTPASVFFSWFPTPKSTIYVQYQYTPEITSIPAYFMQGGFGGKYQVLSFLQLEASYTNFFAGISNGAGATYNVGLRFIK